MAKIRVSPYFILTRLPYGRVTGQPAPPAGHRHHPAKHLDIKHDKIAAPQTADADTLAKESLILFDSHIF